MPITSLQHNIIINFFVMKYNLPTNWLIFFLWKHSGNMFVVILFYVDLSTNSCMTILSFCPFYPHIHCHRIALQLSDAWWISVRCMVKNESQRENHFQSWNKCIFNKNLRKVWLEFRTRIRKKKTHIKPRLYEDIHWTLQNV